MTDSDVPFEMDFDEQTDPVKSKLYEEQEAEAERQGAEFYNFGKGTTDCSVYSKTSKGHLVSDIDSRTMQVTHRWQSYGCQPPWYWRVRAEEARGLVNHMNDSESKDAMLWIAEGYELLARKAEERGADQVGRTGLRASHP